MEGPHQARARQRPARPLPRPQRWTLDVAAFGEPTSWHEPAKRLVAVLREISAAISAEYGRSVRWYTSGEDTGTWSDVDAVHKLMDETASPGDGAHGLLHGHLADGEPAIVDLLWRAGTAGRVLDCTARFNPRGGARPLARHDPDWPIALVGFAVDVADGDAGRIVTSSWLKEDERRGGTVPFWLGEVTYLPGRIDPARIPDSLVTHPWPTGRGAGTVVALADLTATVTAPGQAVDDMLSVRHHLPV